MLRIALADDDREFLELLQEQIRRFFVMKQEPVEIMAFTAGHNLLYEMEDGGSFDACFLDIEMPDMDGITLARRIRERDDRLFLVFVTSHMHYAVDGYEVGACGYLPKLLIREKLPGILARIREEVSRLSEKSYCLESVSRIERIFYSEILYVYKEGKESVLVTGRRELSVRKPLSRVMEELDGREFMTIDRAYVVNLSKIFSLEGRELTMINGAVLPVSRSHLRELKERIHRYWKEGG